jgi:hypothetical protein
VLVFYFFLSSDLTIILFFRPKIKAQMEKRIRDLPHKKGNNATIKFDIRAPKTIMKYHKIRAMNEVQTALNHETQKRMRWHLPGISILQYLSRRFISRLTRKKKRVIPKLLQGFSATILILFSQGCASPQGGKAKVPPISFSESIDWTAGENSNRPTWLSEEMETELNEALKLQAKQVQEALIEACEEMAPENSKARAKIVKQQQDKNKSNQETIPGNPQEHKETVRHQKNKKTETIVNQDINNCISVAKEFTSSAGLIELQNILINLARASGALRDQRIYHFTLSETRKVLKIRFVYDVWIRKKVTDEEGNTISKDRDAAGLFHARSKMRKKDMLDIDIFNVSKKKDRRLEFLGILIHEIAHKTGRINRDHGGSGKLLEGINELVTTSILTQKEYSYPNITELGAILSAVVHQSMFRWARLRPANGASDNEQLENNILTTLGINNKEDSTGIALGKAIKSTDPDDPCFAEASEKIVHHLFKTQNQVALQRIWNLEASLGIPINHQLQAHLRAVCREIGQQSINNFIVLLKSMSYLELRELIRNKKLGDNQIPTTALQAARAHLTNLERRQIEVMAIRDNQTVSMK